MRTVSTAYNGTPSERLEDLVPQLDREPGHEAVEEIRHRLLRKGRERQCRLVRPVPELRVAALELRSSETEDEDRPAAGPLEEMADELDERRVCPLEILEEERDRALISHALEEEAPGAEELFLCVPGPSSRPSRCSIRGSTNRRSSPSRTNWATERRSF